VKLAVIEAEWETQKPPASFMLFGIPNEEKETSDYAIHIPWLLGLIATRSVDTPVQGIIELRERAKKRIQNGMLAYGALQKVRANPATPRRRRRSMRRKRTWATASC